MRCLVAVADFIRWSFAARDRRAGVAFGNRLLEADFLGASLEASAFRAVPCDAVKQRCQHLGVGKPAVFIRLIDQHFHHHQLIFRHPFDARGQGLDRAVELLLRHRLKNQPHFGGCFAADQVTGKEHSFCFFRPQLIDSYHTAPKILFPDGKKMQRAKVGIHFGGPIFPRQEDRQNLPVLTEEIMWAIRKMLPASYA